MKTFQYTKTIQTSYFRDELKQVPEIKPHLLNVNRIGDSVWVLMHDNFNEIADKAKIDAVMTGHDPTVYNLYVQVDGILTAATKFAKRQERGFTNENVRLGITQLGLTNKVRKTLREVLGALKTASLYDVRYEISLVAAVDLDATILTAARLLKFRNNVEEYLGISPLATTYDQPTV